MTRFLYRLGWAVAGHPWRTVAASLTALLLCFAAAYWVGGSPADNYNVPGARSKAGTELLHERFPAMSGAGAAVVITSDSALPSDVLTALSSDLAGMPHVISVSPPRLSADGATALISVRYDAPVTNPDLMANTAPLEEAVAATRADGYTVLLGGELPETVRDLGGRGEASGVLVAILLLILTFGSLVAAGLPLAGAFLGLGLGTAGVTVLAGFTDVSTSAPTVATMVGLGVGIDYGLLLITRFVEMLRAGFDRREAAARANATAGRSVVLAGATVLVSLMGLRLSGLPVYASFGYATAITVGSVVLVSVTLVPALAAVAGRRVLPRRERHARRVLLTRTSVIARWARVVGQRPLLWAVSATVILLALAAPVLDMRTWPQDAGSQPAELEVRQAFDVVAAEFGPGANAPMIMVVDLQQIDRAQLGSLTGRVSSTEGVVTVSPPLLSPDGTAAVVQIEPAFASSDPRTTPLIEHIRDDVLPRGAELTGGSPILSDISVMLEERIWLVIGFVVALSVLLLAVMFRSLVVPIKAAVMNMLSIAAAYGVVVAIFQWGWGTSLLGLDHAMPVSSWIPILMFTVLFGLSMDYEVFLLSRIREDYLATGDPHASVVHGLAATGRVISAAAAIMVAVFLGFSTAADITVTMISIGMAVAIAIDATLIRLVLVPAVMAMLGRWNWWMPRWLDRLLPHVDAESVALIGHHPERSAIPQPESADKSVHGRV